MWNYQLKTQPRIPYWGKNKQIKISEQNTEAVGAAINLFCRKNCTMFGFKLTLNFELLNFSEKLVKDVVHVDGKQQPYTLGGYISANGYTKTCLQAQWIKLFLFLH